MPEKQEVNQLQVVQGKKEEKVSCSNSHRCKVLLKFLYGNRNYPNPLMQLSSICRDTNTSKAEPLDLLQFFDILLRKSCTAHIQTSIGKQCFSLAICKNTQLGSLNVNIHQCMLILLSRRCQVPGITELC